tara:strand:- start:1186 stop:1407 length:222 start_codon:yes stop_codon:yes gene_type:complete
MKDRTMFVLTVGIIIAVIVAIIGDYVVAAVETQTTGEPVEVSGDVIQLAQTALAGCIGILGGYFTGKGIKSDD